MASTLSALELGKSTVFGMVFAEFTSNISNKDALRTLFLMTSWKSKGSNRPPMPKNPPGKDVLKKVLLEDHGG